MHKRERLAYVNIGFQYEKALKLNIFKRQQLSFLFQRETGKPVGWMYPSFHASSKHTNKTTDSSTRTVSARAMFLLRCSSLCASLLRSIKKPALARQTTMASKKRAMAYVMPSIIGRSV